MTAIDQRLLALGEVRQRLGVVSQTYVGAAAIPVERIIGSLDRSVDFGRDFRPRRRGLARRLRNLRQQYPDGNFPPISVYEVGGAYFVVDGHHRVALSRELGREFIDAEVIQLQTGYELDGDVDVLTLVHTHQQRCFLRESGLDDVHPEARFELLRPDAYAELLGLVQAFGYRRSLEAGRLLTRAEMAQAWYADEYLPAVAATHEVGLPSRHPYKSDADFFLWVAARRRTLEPMRLAVSWLEAAQVAAGEFHGLLARRRLTRQHRRPLAHRAGPRKPAPA